MIGMFTLKELGLEVVGVAVGDGLLPSVVIRRIAPGVGSEIVTVSGQVTTPGAVLNTGGTGVSP